MRDLDNRSHINARVQRRANLLNTAHPVVVRVRCNALFGCSSRFVGVLLIAETSAYGPADDCPLAPTKDGTSGHPDESTNQGVLEASLLALRSREGRTTSPVPSPRRARQVGSLRAVTRDARRSEIPERASTTFRSGFGMLDFPSTTCTKLPVVRVGELLLANVAVA